jgi:hypothetical protein
MKKIIKEVKKFNAISQMNDALNTQNDSNFIIYNLLLNLLMLIFCEDKNINSSKSWQESFKLLNIQNESTIIELSNDSIKFRSTSVKSYYQDTNSLSFDVDQLNISSSLESQLFDHTNLNVIIDLTMFMSSDTNTSLWIQAHTSPDISTFLSG